MVAFVAFTVGKPAGVLTSSWLAALGYRAIEAGIRAAVYNTDLPAGAVFSSGLG
jgi:hypothetical protein